jgi:acetyl-CoA synthetase
MLFKGYYNKPGKTAECFAGDWYLTGDLAMMDDAGYIWFESRAGSFESWSLRKRKM